MRGGLIANAALLALAAAWLGTLALPYGRAVRLRNACLLRRGAPADFVWDPARIPPDFRIERLPPPPAIAAAVAAAGLPPDDWPRMRAVVTMLVRQGRREGPIRADLARTYAGIVAGVGYCSDYVRVYLAAAQGSGLFCRQWAFSFDGFGGHGHTFVEAYDRQHARWAFLDVQNNVYAVRAGSEEPLDAMALRAMLLDAPEQVEFRPVGPGPLGFPHLEKLRDYYRRGAHEWYLWWGNDVISRDASGITALVSRVSGRLAHGLASMGTRLPPLVVVVTPDNEAAVVRMERLRRHARNATVLAAVLATTLALQLAPGCLGRRHAG